MNTLKNFLKRIFPRQQSFVRDQIIALQKISKVKCCVENLLPHNKLNLQAIFQSPAILNQWNQDKPKIDQFEFPEMTGGGNPGDVRAIYYLINYFKPATVLELGTHIGISTTHIALAFNSFNSASSKKLITVDIKNVNDEEEKPWLKFSSRRSPQEMINKLGCEHFVEFSIDTSLNYLSKTKNKFDIIYIDDDLSSSVTYNEIPLALKSLNKNGILLVHAYFPDLKPLFPNHKVEPGPFLAIERLIKEGVGIKVVPFAQLPWPTKLNTNLSSLAIIIKK